MKLHVAPAVGGAAVGRCGLRPCSILSLTCVSCHPLSIPDLKKDGEQSLNEERITPIFSVSS